MDSEAFMREILFSRFCWSLRSTGALPLSPAQGEELETDAAAGESASGWGTNTHNQSMKEKAAFKHHCEKNDLANKSDSDLKKGFHCHKPLLNY